MIWDGNFKKFVIISKTWLVGEGCANDTRQQHLPSIVLSCCDLLAKEVLMIWGGNLIVKLLSINALKLAKDVLMIWGGNRRMSRLFTFTFVGEGCANDMRRQHMSVSKYFEQDQLAKEALMIWGGNNGPWKLIHRFTLVGEGGANDMRRQRSTLNYKLRISTVGEGWANDMKRQLLRTLLVVHLVLLAKDALMIWGGNW